MLLGQIPHANGAEGRDVKIAQARDLDVECFSVRRCRTDLDAPHGAQDDARVDFACRGFVLPSLAIR